MKQITIEFVPGFVLSKEILSVWPRRADSGPNRNNLFSIREIRERYLNVLVSFLKDTGTFFLSFLTLLIILYASPSVCRYVQYYLLLYKYKMRLRKDVHGDYIIKHTFAPYRYILQIKV